MDEETMNALKKIKTICENTDYCDKCPFGNRNSECKIIEYNPANWELKEPGEIYRYFDN